MAIAPATLCPLSYNTTFDASGRPVDALLYVFEAGTLTPAQAYSDASLTVPYETPIPTTGNHRLPGVYVGSGVFRYRLTDLQGVILEDVDGVQGAVTTSVTNLITSREFDAPVGSLVPVYRTDAPAGWVRANGRTIGNPVSGATEFADDSTKDLFVVLWNADPSLPVTSGRGNSALADFNLGKQINLPDLRRTVIAGVDGMGNGYKGTSSTDPYRTIGTRLGEEIHTLSVGEMPTHSHISSCSVDGGHIHAAQADLQGIHSHTAGCDQQGQHFHAASMDVQGDHTHAANMDVQGNHSHNGTTDTIGNHSHNYQFAGYAQDGTGDNTTSSGDRKTQVQSGGFTDGNGSHSHNFSTNNTGNHQHTISVVDNGAHLHNITVVPTGQHAHNITVNAAGVHTHNITIAEAGDHDHVIGIANTGFSLPHNNLQPTMPLTMLIKL